MKVALVGVGAVGSFFFDLARNTPGVEWTLVDGDKVETKNLAAQAFRPASVGRNKAEAAALVAKTEWRIPVTARPVMLTENNGVTLLSGHDLVVDCTDNPKARHLIMHICEGLTIPSVHCGIDANGSLGVIRWRENFHPEDGGEGAHTCEDATNRPHHALAAAALAKVVLFFVKDGRKREATIGGIHIQ